MASAGWPRRRGPRGADPRRAAGGTRVPPAAPALQLNQRARGRHGGQLEHRAQRPLARLVGVEHALEEQARGRGGQGGRQLRALAHQARHVLDPQLAAADLGQHPHQAPHHLPQEVRAHHAHQDQGPGLGHLDPLEGDAGGGLVGVVGGEGAEVLEAQEGLGRGPHRLDLEGVLDPPHEGLAEGRAAAGDLVEVGPRLGRVAGVELARDLLHPQQVDVGRQAVVEGEEQLVGPQARLEVEVRHLGQGVHAGVGAAGPVKLEVLALGQVAHRRHDLARHRAGVLLDLPAAVARAVVLEGQLEARHGRTLHRPGAWSGTTRRRRWKRPPPGAFRR